MAQQRLSKTTRRSQTQALAERLYASHHKHLLAIGRRNSITTEDAEEALHDTFILFIEHFDPTGGAPPLAWLTLTLKRRCWLTWRKRQRLHQRRVTEANQTQTTPKTFQTYDPGRAPDDLAIAAAELDDARNKIQSLKQDERRALGLLALGYSYHEICRITGWTYTKVNRCISEGRSALRRGGRLLGTKTSNTVVAKARTAKQPETGSR